MTSLSRFLFASRWVQLPLYLGLVVALANYSEHTVMWQTIIHGIFLLSALALALKDKLMNTSKPH
jgi:uncharacterized membrane protein YqhA